MKMISETKGKVQGGYRVLPYKASCLPMGSIIEGPKFKLIHFCLYLFFLDSISYMNWLVMSNIFLSFKLACCQLNAMPCENTC